MKQAVGRYVVSFQAQPFHRVDHHLCPKGRNLPSDGSVGVDSGKKFFPEELLNWKSKRLVF
jgi:hypothetical protein